MRGILYVHRHSGIATKYTRETDREAGQHFTRKHTNLQSQRGKNYREALRERERGRERAPLCNLCHLDQTTPALYAWSVCCCMLTQHLTQCQVTVLITDSKSAVPSNDRINPLRNCWEPLSIINGVGASSLGAQQAQQCCGEQYSTTEVFPGCHWEAV